MFGLITTKRHRQILAEERAASRIKGRVAAEALAELAKLKASRARSNANLRNANARRKQAAQTT